MQQEHHPLLLRDVFVPGGFPRITYQDRAKHGIEARLRDGLHRLNKFIAVAGPTKSGKTVLVKSVVPLPDRVWIEGGHVASIDDVWNHVAHDLGIASSVVESRSASTETTTASETDASFKPAGIGAGTKLSGGSKEGTGHNLSKTYGGLASKQAVAALIEAKKVLVIDDFHYIAPELQVELIRALKPAVFDGLRVVLILIPHRMHQAASAEIDVDGRTSTILIPEWEDSELFSIGDIGLTKLRLTYTATTLQQLVHEAFKSPHLMQDFCSSLCASSGVSEEYLGALPGPRVYLPADTNDFFRSFAQSISPEAFKALRKGPARTNRKERALNAGGSVDTYEAVLLALHELGGVTPVDWTRLRRALQQVLREVPQQHEVTRALENMDEIAKRELKGEPVIDYVNGELHLVDPFFRYLLKWNTMILDEASP